MGGASAKAVPSELEQASSNPKYHNPHHTETKLSKSDTKSAFYDTMYALTESLS